MQVSPSRQFWLPLMHSLTSRRDTGNAEVIGKDNRSDAPSEGTDQEAEWGQFSASIKSPRSAIVTLCTGVEPWGLPPEQNESNGFSPWLIDFRSIAPSEHLLSKLQAPNWSRVTLEAPSYSGLSPPSISPISQVTGQRRLGMSPGPPSRSWTQSPVRPQAHRPFPAQR